MIESGRKLALQELYTRASQARQGNGYETEVGQRVYWGRTEYFDGGNPMRVEIDSPYPYTRFDILTATGDEPVIGNRQQSDMIVRVDVSGYFKGVNDEREDMERHHFDLERAILYKKRLAAGYWVAYRGFAYETREQGEKISIVTLNLELAYKYCEADFARPIPS